MGGSGDGDLVEFSFESVAAVELPPAALLRMARRASAFNARMGVTGRLRLHGGRFVQTIEGRCAVVLELAARILADSRHEAIRTTSFRAIPERSFADWAVSGFSTDAVDVAGVEHLRLLPAVAAARRVAYTASIYSLGARSL
jgi:hypothetical protein